MCLKKCLIKHTWNHQRAVITEHETRNGCNMSSKRFYHFPIRQREAIYAPWLAAGEYIAAVHGGSKWRHKLRHREAMKHRWSTPVVKVNGHCFCLPWHVAHRNEPFSDHRDASPRRPATREAGHRRAGSHVIGRDGAVRWAGEDKLVGGRWHFCVEFSCSEETWRACVGGFIIYRASKSYFVSLCITLVF